MRNGIIPCGKVISMAVTTVSKQVGVLIPYIGSYNRADVRTAISTANERRIVIASHLLVEEALSLFDIDDDLKQKISSGLPGYTGTVKLPRTREWIDSATGERYVFPTISNAVFSFLAKHPTSYAFMNHCFEKSQEGGKTVLVPVIEIITVTSSGKTANEVQIRNPEQYISVLENVVQGWGIPEAKFGINVGKPASSNQWNSRFLYIGDGFSLMARDYDIHLYFDMQLVYANHLPSTRLGVLADEGPTANAPSTSQALATEVAVLVRQLGSKVPEDLRGPLKALVEAASQ